MSNKLNTKLSNFEIKKLTDKNLQEYFMIINNDNRDEVYFCFKTKISEEQWEILTKMPSPLNIEIDYEENEQNGRIYKRAVALYTDDIFV
ncbi:MAG: hypothetical protein mread185_000544 [Mycoplasmataceae bacterium]|nr:MAG: hypothetical protein mread185_000544 [Mycoplasmataceae bacterium]